MYISLLSYIFQNTFVCFCDPLLMYVDFFFTFKFRETLISHASPSISVDPTVGPTEMDGRDASDATRVSDASKPLDILGKKENI